MKAVVCKAFGPPEALVVEEMDDPTAGDGQLLMLLGGFGTGDGMAINRDECSQLIIEWVARNIGGTGVPDTPNAWLYPFPDMVEFDGSRDTAWWVQKSLSLQRALGGVGPETRRMLSERLFVLEAHPYPARAASYPYPVGIAFAISIAPEVFGCGHPGGLL